MLEAALCALAVAAHAAFVDLEARGENGVRVRVVPDGGKLEEPVVSALLPGPKIKRSAGPSAQTVRNGNLEAAVDGNNMVTVTRISDGKVLLKTNAIVFSPPPSTAAPTSVAANVTFSCPSASATSRMYGLGEHYGLGVQVAFPYVKVLANSLFYKDSHGSDVSIPWFCTSDGLGFVWNNPSLGTVNMTSWDSMMWSGQAVRNVDFWVTTTPAGPSQGANPFPALFKDYATVVGFPKPLPYWATGFIQSKDRYRNQTQLMDVARGYVKRGLPVSMIVIDWFHWVNMGDWELNPSCWPDPGSMVKELKELGIELMITFWPYQAANVSKHWAEFSGGGFLATSTATGKPEPFWGPDALVDPTNPDSRKATFDAWMAGYGKYGVRSIWMDESEPDHTNYISGGQWKFAAGSDSELLPGWVSDWGKVFAEGLAGEEHFILSRNAWAGTPGKGLSLWSGDVSSTWLSLNQSVRVAQQVAMSGIPAWTTDIGGYIGGNVSDPKFQELIVRWFQFGAFCPLFRLHGHRQGLHVDPVDSCGYTNGPNEVWHLAPQPDQYAAIEAVMKLREQLRGYVKQLNDNSVATGFPMLAPTFLHFPNDTVAASPKVDGQFMLGPDWLISPVTTLGATSWGAYLPVPAPGEQWVYWWTQEPVAPGWQVLKISTLSDFPLYYRRPSK